MKKQAYISPTVEVENIFENESILAASVVTGIILSEEEADETDIMSRMYSDDIDFSELDL